MTESHDIVTSNNGVIEISKFVFWAITACLGAGIIGFVAWINNQNTYMAEVRIDLATVVEKVSNLDARVKENLEVAAKVTALHSQLGSMRVELDNVKAQVERHSRKLDP